MHLHANFINGGTDGLRNACFNASVLISVMLHRGISTINYCQKGQTKLTKLLHFINLSS